MRNADYPNIRYDDNNAVVRLLQSRYTLTVALVNFLLAWPAGEKLGPSLAVVSDIVRNC